MGATASPISSPKAASSPMVSCCELRAAKRMPIRQAKAAMNAMMPTTPFRSRPSQAPSANSAAVAATYAIVCANRAWAWPRAAVPIRR